MDSNLPKGWIDTEINQIYQVVKEKGDPNIIPYLEIGNVDINNKEYDLTDKPSVKGCIKAVKNDTLISRVRPTRGAITIIKENRLLVSSAFTVLRNSFGLNDEYLFYYLAYNNSFLNYLGENCTGTMYPTVGENFIINYSIPLAPLSEQQRIAEKVDGLMARISNSKSRLQKIPILLKNFRQSILVAAVSGELTKEWREENVVNESAIEFIEKIKTKNERIDFETGELPDKWINIRIGQAFEIVRGSSPRPKGDPRFFASSKTDYHWIMLSDFTDNTKNNVLFNTNEYLTKEGTKYGRHVNQNDILVGVSGVYGVGRTCLLNIEGYIYDGIMAIKNVGDENLRKFINFFMQLQRMKFMDVATGTSWPNINTDILKNYIFPIPPPEEQKEIVRKVEELFHYVDNIEARYQKAKAWFDILPHSILAKAFRGELVSQNENDEPANVLLERIKEAKKHQIDLKKRVDIDKSLKKNVMKPENNVDLIKELKSRFRKSKFKLDDFKDLFTNNNYDEMRSSFFDHVKQNAIEMIYDSKVKTIFFKLK